MSESEGRSAEDRHSPVTSDGEAVVEGAVLDKPNPVLRLDGVTKSFGGLTANDDVSMAVEEGSITGLIGPNGAGKSTLFNCITGFHQPDTGTVRVRDQDVTGLRPHEVAHHGLIRSFQTPRKPEGMTVREALLVGPQRQLGESLVPLFTAGSKVSGEERRSLERAEAILDQFEIGHLGTALATDLSGGQMKLVELARAMMTEPDILLLDEPVAGVNPTLAEKLKGYIRQLNEDGITFLIIEHDMSFIMDIADSIIVLNQGAVLAEGPPEKIQQDERVIDAYLGGPRT